MQPAVLFAGFLISISISVFAIPSIVRVALSKGLYGVVRQESSFQKKVPTLGGLAIFAAVLIPLNLLSNIRDFPLLPYLTAGSLILFFIGIKDDILVIAPWWKLSGQILAAAVICIPGKLVLDNPLDFLGIVFSPDWMKVSISILVMLILVNAFNLIDGIDGLAAVLGILASGAMGWVFYNSGLPGWTLISVLLIGGLMGFGWFNVFSRKKRIYMGDTGTLVVGYLLAILAIRFLNLPDPGLGVWKIKAVNVFILTVFLIPVSDMLRIILVRIFKKRSPFRPDRQHVHYLMLDVGMNHLQITGILFAYNLLIIIIGLLLKPVREWPWMMLMILITILLFFIPGRILRFRREKKKHI